MLEATVEALRPTLAVLGASGVLVAVGLIISVRRRLAVGKESGCKTPVRDSSDTSEREDPQSE